MTNFVLIPKPDPTEVLWRHFPELKAQFDDGDSTPYCLYGAFSVHLTNNRGDHSLWKRAHALFDELATGSGDLPDFLVLGIFENLPADIDLRSALGTAARELWDQFQTWPQRPTTPPL